MDFIEGELALDNGQVEESIDELLKITPESPLYVDALLLQADTAKCTICRKWPWSN